jgi:serine/threonine protein kinase
MEYDHRECMDSTRFTSGTTRTRLRESVTACCYAAPELLKNILDDNRPIFSTCTDVWAFGCILFEVITQERLFETQRAVMMYSYGRTVEFAAHLMRKSVKEWLAGVSEDGNQSWSYFVADTLVRTIEREPGARPSSTQLKGILDQVLKGGLPSLGGNKRATRRIVLGPSRSKNDSEVTAA